MTLNELKTFICRPVSTPERSVRFLYELGYDVRSLRCMLDRARLPSDVRQAAQSELDKLSCCDG